MEDGNITFAKMEWIPQLKQIWKECFHDEDSYIDFYFMKRFTEENMLVWLEDKLPVAMASLLPCTCWEKKNGLLLKQPVRYIYAVATKPGFKGQGISTKLMKYIQSFLDQNHEIGILVPAEESLISFYGKRNFHPAIRAKERVNDEAERFELQISSLSDILIKEGPVLAKKYKQIRDSWLGMDGYIEWDEDAIDYAIKENLLIGGLCFEMICEGESHIIMGYIDKEQFIVRETTLSEHQWDQYAMTIANEFECSRILQKERFFMSTRKNWAKTSYFNLALD